MHQIRTPVALLAVLLAALSIAAAPAAAAPDRSGPTAVAQVAPDRGVSAQPRARAACPVCPVIAVTAIRTIAVRAAPIAVRAAGRIGSSTARRRVASGASKVKTFTKRTVRVSGVKLVAAFERLPRYARGCGRGFVDYIRDPADLRLSAVFIACGRGIVDIYLGKSPYRPIDR